MSCSMASPAIEDGMVSSLAFIKQAVGIKSGANKTGRETVGKITRTQLREIAEKKMKDLNANDLEAAARIIEGSARSMGLEIVEA